MVHAALTPMAALENVRTPGGTKQVLQGVLIITLG